MSNERIVPNSNQIISQFGDKIKGFGQQLKSTIVNINKYAHLVVNGDWSIAINTAIIENENGIVFIPGGEYNCKNTINFSNKCKLLGIKDKTKLILTTPNIPLIDYGSQDHAILECLSLKGLGNTEGQIGIKLSVWNSTINDCTISGFNTGIDTIGVLVDINRCYINGCTKAIDIKPLGDYAPSTMISLNKVLLHYNDIGVFTSSYGDPNRNRPCIGLYMDECAFEWNQYAFKIDGVMYTSIADCWFEQNTNRPETYPSDLILTNNRYEYSDGKDQTIKFLTNETWEYNVYGGYSEMSPGYLKTKTVEFEEYASTDMSRTATSKLGMYGGKLSVDNRNIATTSSFQNNHYTIIVNKNGITHTDIPEGYLTFIKQEVGKYNVKLTNNRRFSNPLITATFVNDDGGTEVIGTTKLHFRDLATYLDWNSVDEMNLSSYNREDNLPCDSRVMISIWCDKIQEF